MAAFRISRAPSASAAASHDPFAKLVFEPALESDELFDALREAYPALKTHTERKKQAVLDFLMSERQAIEQEITAFVSGTASSAAAVPATAATPADFSQDSWESPADPTPSVARTNSRKPASSYSGDESSPSSSSAAGPSSSSAGSSPETLSLKQMTTVWTASGDAPPKIHHRRSMTTKEKEEYRRRRQMKACQDCRARKRKCCHNTNAPETTTAVGVSSAKVKKRSQAQQQPPPQSQSQSQSHPYHATPSESSFQLDGASVWGDGSLMGSSIMESPLDFCDFGPAAAAHSGTAEGFDDFLLLPDEDELSMAFSPDPLFSATTPMTTTGAMQNTATAFPYAYVDPFLPTPTTTQTYDHSLRSGSSASASAFSSPGRASQAHANANSQQSIAPAHMHQSPQNWDLDLAGVGVNMDFTGHEHLLHGQNAVPTTSAALNSGSSGGGTDSEGVGVVNDNGRLNNTAGVVQPLHHRINQPQASRSSGASASSSSSPSSATPAISSSATPAASSATSAASSSSAGRRKFLRSPGAEAAQAQQQVGLGAVQQPAQTHTCEGVGTPVASVSGPAAGVSSPSAAPLSRGPATSNGNSTSTCAPAPSVVVNTTISSIASSAPATGLVCYAPQSRTTATTSTRRTNNARRAAGFFNTVSDAQVADANASGREREVLVSTASRDAPRFTARVLDGHGHGAASRPFVLVDFEAETERASGAVSARASGSAVEVPSVLGGSQQRRSCTASQSASKASTAQRVSKSTALSILLLAASSTALLPLPLALTPWPHQIDLLSSLLLCASLLCVYAYAYGESSSSSAPWKLDIDTGRAKGLISSLSCMHLRRGVASGKVALFGPGIDVGRAVVSSFAAAGVWA
ncbi:uncharacterized protein BKA78DRAFT_307659 [Phyllosticta capitalensis]|uniref:uncharacterized protein n=1 Tax=Phyllosticta capitalensis TaxID=121624 RepID=UPI00312D20A2